MKRRTRELRSLMHRYRLTMTSVGKYAGCTRQAVRLWLRENPAIPDHRLRLLRSELKG